MLLTIIVDMIYCEKCFIRFFAASTDPSIRSEKFTLYFFTFPFIYGTDDISIVGSIGTSLSRPIWISCIVFPQSVVGMN